jgi:hypothetical protein
MIEATRLLLVESEYGGYEALTGVSLDTALQGSWVGSELAAMRSHSAAVEKSRRERERYEADSCERREEKRRQRFAAHELRQQQKRNRDALRQDVIAELRGMSPTSRLGAITKGGFSLPLEALPSDLVPVDPASLKELSDEQRAAALDRIGNRRGPWGHLRSILQRGR